MKTYIWDIPTRIIHWLIVLLFTITAILGETESSMNFHYLLGFSVAIVVIIRIFYGIFGPKYTNFKDFFYPLNHYFKNIIDRNKKYAGHNPHAAIVMLLILILIFLCSLSGLLLALTEANIINFVGEESLEEAHEILPRILYFLVAFHLLGLIIDAIIHPDVKTPLSMFTGNKMIDASQDLSNKIQRISIFTLFIIGFIIILIFSSKILPSLPIENDNTEQNSNEGGESDDDD